jgi:hypothetical protein
MNLRYNFFFILVFAFCYAGTASAQSPVYLASTSAPLKASISTSETEVSLNTDLSKAQQRRQLMVYLKGMESTDINYNPAKVKRLYSLANLFTRLRLYPLAMKCFLKTMQQDVDSISAGNIPITASDDSLLEKQESLPGADTDKEISSKPISNEAITATFNDGKTAIAYAMIFHVKQPVRGKPKIFKLANTGHTFITLIKYNSDSTYAAISFGFYPKKDNPLSATPIIPSTSSTFKDDSEHAWDEVVGKFISKRRFNKILALTQQYRNVSYHLSKNNCTDFGLKAAALAGLQVWDTKGSWPLGSGNNPGITGQSLLEGKFDNTDTGDRQQLLITNRN